MGVIQDKLEMYAFLCSNNDVFSSKWEKHDRPLLLEFSTLDKERKNIQEGIRYIENQVFPLIKKTNLRSKNDGYFTTNTLFDLLSKIEGDNWRYICYQIYREMRMMYTPLENPSKRDNIAHYLVGNYYHEKYGECDYFRVLVFCEHTKLYIPHKSFKGKQKVPEYIHDFLGDIIVTMNKVFLMVDELEKQFNTMLWEIYFMDKESKTL
jgi:hypothetical protein